MSANNLFAIEVHINLARVSVGMRRICAQLDPEYTIPSCVPRPALTGWSKHRVMEPDVWFSTGRSCRIAQAESRATTELPC